MVKMSHLKQIGRFDYIQARIFELNNTQYILEIYDEKNEDLSNIMVPTFTIEKSLPNMPFIENISQTIMENIKYLNQETILY